MNKSEIDKLTEEELDNLIGSVLYYVGIHPDKMAQDLLVPRHEMLGGVRMALRRLFKCAPEHLYGSTSSSTDGESK